MCIPFIVCQAMQSVETLWPFLYYVCSYKKLIEYLLNWNIEVRRRLIVYLYNTIRDHLHSKVIACLSNCLFVISNPQNDETTWAEKMWEDPTSLLWKLLILLNHFADIHLSHLVKYLKYQNLKGESYWYHIKFL